jgi:hypothetical protein
MSNSFIDKELLKSSHRTKYYMSMIEKRKTELIISEDQLENIDFKKLATMIDKLGSLNPDILIYINTINFIEDKIKSKQTESQQIKRRELNRISKEYFRNDYERRFGVPVETMFSALVGIENISSELIRHNREHRVRGN